MIGGDDRNQEGRQRGGDRFNRPGRFDEPDRLPWMQEVEEDESDGMSKGQKRFLLVIGAIIMVSLFASLIFYAYDRGRQEAMGVGNEPPVVLANDGPAKVQPNDRGGLNVPDQDRLVFNTLNNQNANNQTGQTFTASPEQPVERPSSSTAATTQQPVTQQPVTQQPVTQQPVTQQPVAQQQALDDPTTSSPIARPTTNTQNDATVIPAGAFRIQLGAFGSNRSTEIAWAQLQDRHPIALGRLSLEVEPLVRASSATLYRLRAGPFPSRVDADAACLALRNAGQGCFVVSP